MNQSKQTNIKNSFFCGFCESLSELNQWARLKRKSLLLELPKPARHMINFYSGLPPCLPDPCASASIRENPFCWYPFSSYQNRSLGWAKCCWWKKDANTQRRTEKETNCGIKTMVEEGKSMFSRWGKLSYRFPRPTELRNEVSLVSFFDVITLFCSVSLLHMWISTLVEESIHQFVEQFFTEKSTLECESEVWPFSSVKLLQSA